TARWGPPCAPAHPTIFPIQPGFGGGVSDAFVTMIDSVQFTWGVTSPPPPVITDPGSQASAEGATVSLPIVATNPNGGTLRYAAVSLPPGLNIDQNTGVIHGTIDSSAAEFFGGSYQPTVIVVDGKGGSADRSFTWAVTDTAR